MAAKQREVRQGECFLSIAHDEGLPWKKIWEDGANADLRKKRETPGILAPGDILTIPEKAPGRESAATEQRHTFRRLGGLVELRIRVWGIDRARANEPYHLEIGDTVYPGATKTTDADGLAICRIPADAETAILVVGKEPEEYELLIGHLDPVDTPSGMHGRLENMGFDTGGVESPWDDTSATALEDLIRESDESIDDRDVHDPEDERNHKTVKARYGI